VQVDFDTNYLMFGTFLMSRSWVRHYRLESIKDDQQRRNWYRLHKPLFLTLVINLGLPWKKIEKEPKS
jgi:hypothetical protein